MWCAYTRSLYMRHYQLCFLILFMLNNVEAKVYKCQKQNGKIEYSESECTGTKQIQYINPSLNFTGSRRNEVSSNDYSRGNIHDYKSEAFERKKKERKQQCKSAKNKLKNASKSLKAKCKSMRDSFCNQSSETIQEIYRRQASFQMADSRNRVSPVVKNHIKELKKNVESACKRVRKR